MHRDIVWEWVDRVGLEHLSLDIAPDGIAADGLVVVALDGRPVRLRYSVRCDAQWVFREDYEASAAVDALDPNAFFGQEVNALDRVGTEFAKSVISAILEAF